MVYIERINISICLLGGFLFARECYNQYMGIHGGAIVNITADMWNGMPLMVYISHIATCMMLGTYLMFRFGVLCISDVR